LNPGPTNSNQIQRYLVLALIIGVAYAVLVNMGTAQTTFLQSNYQLQQMQAANLSPTLVAISAVNDTIPMNAAVALNLIAPVLVVVAARKIKTIPELMPHYKTILRRLVFKHNIVGGSLYGIAGFVALIIVYAQNNSGNLLSEMQWVGFSDWIQFACIIVASIGLMCVLGEIIVRISEKNRVGTQVLSILASWLIGFIGIVIISAIISVAI